MKSSAATCVIDAMFADLSDSRVHPVEHDLTAMLVIAPCAILAGSTVGWSSHRRIKNRMHWVLDMAFGEDECRITSNLLHTDTKTKVGIKNRRFKAAINDSCRALILGLSALI